MVVVVGCLLHSNFSTAFLVDVSFKWPAVAVLRKSHTTGMCLGISYLISDGQVLKGVDILLIWGNTLIVSCMTTR